MTDDIARSFVQLALAIDRHRPGYVDAYYGPPAWRARAAADGPRPLVRPEAAPPGTPQQ